MRRGHWWPRWRNLDRDERFEVVMLVALSLPLVAVGVFALAAGMGWIDAQGWGA